MSATLEHQIDNIYQFKITGEFKRSDLEDVQGEFLDYLVEAGAVRILFLLEHFTGWENGSDWGDNSFFFSHGDYLEKIAIVSDPKWEAELLMFSGAGVRKAPVKFFPPSAETEARAWLAE